MNVPLVGDGPPPRIPSRRLAQLDRLIKIPYRNSSRSDSGSYRLDVRIPNSDGFLAGGLPVKRRVLGV